MALLRPGYSWIVAVFFVVGSSGPAFGSHWEAIGPFGGHAHRIAIDPADPNHLYAATKTGHIYQSTDAGQRWEALEFNIDSAASLSAFVANPKSANELFVGVSRNYATTDASGDNSGDTGIYKSTDGGVRWTRLQPTKGWSVLSLAVHPVKTHIVLAGTEEGVFRSDNGGSMWKRISPLNHPQIKAIVSLAFDPVNTRTIYAGTTHLPWKTSDGGATWQSIHVGMADDSDVFSIVVNHANTQVVLLGACSGIYRTASGGVRWAAIPGIPESSLRTYQVIQDPVNALTFYAATARGLWKSVDGGRVWKQPNPNPYIVNFIAIDPQSPNTVYLATDQSGLLKSVDGGITFAPINQGFVNRNIGRIVSEDGLYVTSAYDGDFGGIFTTYDRGLSWALNSNQNALQGRNIISLAVAPGNAALLIAGSYDGLLRSTDGGKAWELVSTFPGVTAATGKIHDVSFSHVNPDTIYIATDRGLLKSTDSGSSWSRNSTGSLNTAIYKLATHPADSQKMMVHTAHGVLISHDDGVSWDPLNFGKDTAVYDVAFSDSAGPDRILAASSRGVLSSEDDGQTWQLTKGLPDTRFDQILLVRTRPQEMYVLSRYRRQIWRSVDAGTEWLEVGNRGLEGKSLLFLSVAEDQPFVVTENHGVFRFDTQDNLPQSSRGELP